MLLLEKTRVRAKEPEVHDDGEDRADTNQHRMKTGPSFVRDRKVAQADEKHLKHCETRKKGQKSYLKTTIPEGR